jgi:alpha-tubulin suppressor-like RCC1 family protein
MTYTASVLSSVKSLQVTPTVTDSAASVKVNGLAVASGASSSPISLSVGNNPIQVVVTAQDGSTISNYTVTVFVPSAVATLSGLTCNSGSLSPTFTSGTTAYAVSVANDCTVVTLTPTVAEPNATMRVNGTLVGSGTASMKIPVLASGSNVINVVVTAQDGTTTQTYAVNVNRPPMTRNFASATTVPLSVSSYDATGNFANLSLSYAPTPGTTLTLVKLTGLGFIQGRFTNLAQGQYVSLVYQGVVYRFVVNYYGGTGNDLVLQWANDQTYAWGANSYGQLGNNGTSNSSLPTPVLGSGALSGKTVVAVSAGSFHSLALCADGTLVAWGRNDLGQLGDNSTTSSSVPVAITNSGALSGKMVVAISAGYYHNLALCSDGTMVAWGQNTYGQLGDGSKTNRSVPVAVSAAGGLSGKTVSGIAAGYYHNLAQCTDGSLVAWGRNTYGQLGNNSTTDSSAPVDITSLGVLNGLSVAQFAAGSDHSLVLCTDGSLAAWGRNNYGQLGEGSGANSSVPVEVDSTDVLAGKIVTSISAGGWHNLALCSDGMLAAFGRNTSGQLGDGGTTNSGLPLVANLSGLSGKAIATVQAANGHSLALCADGSIYAWGSNSNGQLGNGGTTSSSLPVAVTTSPLGSGERFMTLATGTSASHSMASVAAPPTNTGFSVWTASHAELSDSTALGDPDGDGIPNVMEYVLHGNPTVTSTAVLPVVSQNASSFQFSFSRDVASAADTTQVFQYSTDLIHWTELSLTPPTDARVTIGAEDGAGMQPVTVTIPKAANSPMFGRLKVTQP